MFTHIGDRSVYFVAHWDCPRIKKPTIRDVVLDRKGSDRQYKRLYKDPTDFTKPQQTIQRPKKIITRHKTLDKNPKY